MSEGRYRVANMPSDKVGNASVLLGNYVVVFNLPWDTAEYVADQLNAHHDIAARGGA